MKYTDQSAQDLTLKLCKTSPDYKQFSVLRQGAIENKALHVEASIIGASHIVVVSSGDSVLSEIFSCDKSPGKSCLISAPLSDLLLPKIETIGNLRYEFVAEVKEGCANNRQLEELREAARINNAESLGLEFEFPSNDDGCPLTVVLVKIDSSGVTIKTAHSYPNENNVTFTRTLITLTKE